jgi:hypothetical protein
MTITKQGDQEYKMLCQYNEQVARKQGKKKMKAPPIVEDNPDETIVDFD